MNTRNRDGRKRTVAARLLLALLVLAGIVGAVAGDEAALAGKKGKGKPKQVTLTDRAVQSGAVLANANGVLIGGVPFAFGNADKLGRLSKVTIAATIDAGDSGPGEFDENDLVLALDGIDTGIVLTGFRGTQTDTRTISGAPDNAGKILAALRQDGELVASIIDRDPNDNVVSLPANFEATLELQGRAAKKK